MTKKPLSQRIASLREVIELSDGRINPDLTTRGQQVLRQAKERLTRSDGATVVALAGATGSGKSSLFNALSGTQLAHPGVRRPTTSTAMATTWGSDATALLDWLDIGLRHRVVGGRADFDGLVLIDLPDHDSTEQSHRDEVDRLVQVVDLLIWVVDPQKYADAALHERYLRPMASHAEIMTVVLNKADTLPDTQLASCLADLRRLLDGDGLSAAKLTSVSATSGAGIERLQADLATIVQAKTSANARLQADVDSLVPQLVPAVGNASAPKSLKAFREPLISALSEAAGVPGLVAASRSSVKLRGGRATGWPLVSWLSRFRSDPIRRAALPVAVTDNVAGSGVSNALRTLVAGATTGLPESWVTAVDQAARSSERTLPHHLTDAVRSVPVLVPQRRFWWSSIRVLQWLLIACVLAGLGWLALNLAMIYFQLPLVPTFPIPVWGQLSVPVPTFMVFGGLLAGVLLGVLSMVAVSISAGRVSRRIRRELRAEIGEVVDTAILTPVAAELDRYRQAQKALAAL